MQLKHPYFHSPRHFIRENVETDRCSTFGRSRSLSSLTRSSGSASTGSTTTSSETTSTATTETAARRSLIPRTYFQHICSILFHSKENNTDNEKTSSSRNSSILIATRHPQLPCTPTFSPSSPSAPSPPCSSSPERREDPRKRRVRAWRINQLQMTIHYTGSQLEHVLRRHKGPTATNRTRISHHYQEN